MTVEHRRADHGKWRGGRTPRDRPLFGDQDGSIAGTPVRVTVRPKSDTATIYPSISKYYVSLTRLSNSSSATVVRKLLAKTVRTNEEGKRKNRAASGVRKLFGFCTSVWLLYRLSERQRSTAKDVIGASESTGAEILPSGNTPT